MSGSSNSDAIVQGVAPFGRLPLAPELELFGITTPHGILTAFRAPAVGVRRGTVLCIPGFTGSKEDFRLLLPAIAALGWDAVGYSQRGQADSVAPQGITNYDLPHLAADALLVAEHVGAEQASAEHASAELIPAAHEPLHLVGHSLGGLVARAAVLARPELFASLTMLCSGPGGRAGVHQADATFVAAHGLRALWDGGRPIQTVGEKLSAREVFERDRFAASSVDNYLGLTRILQETPDSTAALASTAVPVLVAHGDTDDAWPVDVQREMAARLGALYRVIPLAGHLPNIDNPGYTAAVLADFFSDGAVALAQ